MNGFTSYKLLVVIRESIKDDWRELKRIKALSAYIDESMKIYNACRTEFGKKFKSPDISCSIIGDVSVDFPFDPLVKTAGHQEGNGNIRPFLYDLTRERA